MAHRIEFYNKILLFNRSEDIRKHNETVNKSAI